MGPSRSLKMSPFDRAPIHDFLLTFINHGPISYRFRDRRRYGDFSRKSQNFPTPCILCPRWRGSLGIGCRRWGPKTRVLGTGPTKKFDDNLAVLIECTNVTDRRTDRQGRQQRPRLCIASRSKTKNAGVPRLCMISPLAMFMFTDSRARGSRLSPAYVWVLRTWCLYRLVSIDYLLERSVGIGMNERVRSGLRWWCLLAEVQELQRMMAL